jgi:hypothetical protein
MKTLKLNKASITFRKYVDSKIDTSTKLQKKAIDISKAINDDYSDNIKHIILVCSNDSMTSREVKNNKQYIESKLGKSKEYLNHLQLAFRIAGSKVIKAKFKACNNNIKKFVDSIEKENEKPFSQTSINDYKNKRLVDDKGNITLKSKKEKVKSKKDNKVMISALPYNQLSDSQLVAIIDNCNFELNRRAKQQKVS